MTKKIAYISGTRADFGLMTPVLNAIDKTEDLKLHLYATGMHLMSEFGFTIDQVKLNFPLVKKIEVTFDQSKESRANFIAEYSKKLLLAFKLNCPDLVLVLGDRVEMLTTAMICSYLKIPIAHLHGGEKTTTIDDVARHAIVKLSNLHFPATETAAKRIKKMGEETWRIRVVGAPALDIITKINLPNKVEVCDYLNLKNDEEYILITLHPVSEQVDEAKKQITATLKAAKEFKQTKIIIYPNADPGGLDMINVIKKYENQPEFRIFQSIPYELFLATEKYAAVWLGNSSAGIIESPSFKTPVVNIGDRQIGRKRAKNIIDVPCEQLEIINAIKKALSKEFKQGLKDLKNPWGDGQAAKKIVQTLTAIDINDKLLNKQLTY